MQPIRTLSLIPVQIKITYNTTIPLYKKLASKIKKLRVLGITNIKIAAKLRISIKTVQKSLENK